MRSSSALIEAGFHLELTTARTATSMGLADELDRILAEPEGPA
jgi:hypothetical protein